MVVVSSISLPYKTDEREAFAVALRRLGVGNARCEIYRRSIDARRKSDIRRVYSVAVDVDEGALKGEISGVRVISEAQYSIKEGGTNTCRPVVVGFGPCGMFAALALARAGYRPIVLERGGSVERRAQAVERFFSGGELDPENNIQFGEGGAGTFSDGKLTTRIGDFYNRYILKTFVEFGAPDSVLKDARPHIGTDILRLVVSGIRKEIEKLGGEVRFGVRLEDITERPGGVAAVTNAGELFCKTLILAVGHSARDTAHMLARRGFELEAKPFSCGLRIEQKQSVIDKALYGAPCRELELPPAEYQLSKRIGRRGVYTFCMCPGGVVVAAASECGGVVVNGMSCSARNGQNANSAVAVSVLPSDFSDSPLEGIEFQRALERRAFEAAGGGYFAPVQSASEFAFGRAAPDLAAPTYRPGVVKTDLEKIMPAFMSEMLRLGLRDFERRIKGFAEGAVLTGIETRTSSPLRVVRGAEMRAVGNRYVIPCGEGAGYAGGIMSAAAEGLRAAAAAARGQE